MKHDGAVNKAIYYIETCHAPCEKNIHSSYVHY